MADTVQPRFSEGENGGRMMAETAALLESKWALDETQQGLEKTFNFPTYAKALDFILLIGVETKLQNHHPELRNSYKSVFYHWTTHQPRGLSSKDVHMARLCEEKAKLLGYLTRGGNEQKAPPSVT
ncbi:MAG: hypothetical protein ALECFALPRED_004505 [Alectoria fallacina]|uniref:4a-hydroxytetrahydrobiopterin dehydratase n=1 Tax=Alectoria fallacina TaxID=1903189 RepID=A0A8H3FYZ0_9LECA|nr:MAG: hypothetical protein ALECFALPRED_004505 [Alectoria fallacina]